MDISDLVRRTAEVLPHPVKIGDNGKARISPDFDALQRDIETALQGAGDNAELKSLAENMTMMREVLSNPEVAKSLAEGRETAREPQPEIFHAIENGDLDAIREALKTWDINATFGKYEATALYHAMAGFETSLDVMHLLLDEGADPNKGLTDSNVLQGLGFANLNGIEPDALMLVVKRCVDLGADIEQRSNRLQWTPLITAASEWNPVAVEALLLAGADINARAGDVEGVCFAGSDSFEFANGHAETMAVLKRYARTS